MCCGAVEVLELDEVQHGIAAAGSSRVMTELARRGVRLNICPTSNLKLGRVASLRDHPIRRLHDAGVRVTVNTDGHTRLRLQPQWRVPGLV